MDNYDKEIVTFKVNSQNIINDIINYSVPLLIKELEIYKGLQILKQDYTLLKKISDKTDLILKDIKEKFKDISILYLNSSQYSIFLNIQLRFNTEKYFKYYEGYKYICHIENLTLKALNEFKPIPEINLNEQLKIYDNCLNLLKELETEKQKLNPYSLTEKLK